MAEERVQRRFAADLAADVLGYSRLMRENEAGILVQLKTLRKEVFDPALPSTTAASAKLTISTARSTPSTDGEG